MKNKTKSLLLLPALAAFAVGCAGSGSVGAGSAANAFAGKYAGTGKVDDNKNAALDMTIAANGNASGTLTVTPGKMAAPGANAFSFPIGVHNVTGTADSSGNFDIGGSVDGQGTFNIKGKVGLNTTTNYTITAGGLTFTGSIAVVGGVGGGSLTFSQATGTNANTSAWPATAFTSHTTVAGTTALITFAGSGSSQRMFNITIGSAVAQGETVAFQTLGGKIFATYTEGTAADPTKVWVATSGSMKLVTRSGGEVKVEFINAKFVPNTAATNTATGSFVLNGTIEK